MMRRRLGIIVRSYFTSAVESIQELLERAESDPCHETRCDLYARAIRQCGGRKSLEQGRRVHHHIVGRGFAHERLLMNLLVEMYGKCGNLDEAQLVFNSILNPNAFSWTILIVAYAQNGELLRSIDLFRAMELHGIKPTLVTCASLIAVCASLGELKLGKELHERYVECGFMLNSIVENSLVNLYGKCGKLAEARGVFDEMFERDVITWTSLISAYVQHRHFREAIQSFHEMAQQGVKPNDITFSSVLEACASLGDLIEARRAHSQIIEWGDCSGNAAELISTYGRCSSVRDAEKVLESLRDEADLNTSKTMLLVYSQFGMGGKALELFRSMNQRDEASYSRVLSSLTGGVGEGSFFEAGKAIHLELIESGAEQGLVLQTAIIKMYLNFGCFQEAAELFHRMKERDMFAWTVMITAHTERGEGDEALKLFQQTRLEGLGFNKFVATSALDACATVGAFRQGLQIHQMISQLGYELDAVLGSVLVNLYWKSGSLSAARSVFNSVALKDVICWNAMLSGYSYHGLLAEAVGLMRQATLEGVSLSEITFQCVLFACSHAGKLEEAWKHFVEMIGDHGIVPIDEHFRCMIDLLGRAGHLHEAEELINTMPVEPAEVAWTMLLGACRVHRDTLRGRRIAEIVCDGSSHESLVEDQTTSPYVLLSNLYCDS